MSKYKIDYEIKSLFCNRVQDTISKAFSYLFFSRQHMEDIVNLLKKAGSGVSLKIEHVQNTLRNGNKLVKVHLSDISSSFLLRSSIVFIICGASARNGSSGLGARWVKNAGRYRKCCRAYGTTYRKNAGRKRATGFDLIRA